MESEEDGDGDAGESSGDGPPATTGSTRGASNRLLAAMPQSVFEFLEPSLERIDLKLQDVLVGPGETFSHVYFPEGSIISVVNYMKDGSGVEVGTVGIEGMAGLPAYLEAEASEGTTFCQMAGPAVRAPVAHVIEAAQRYPDLRRLLNRYVQAYVTQVAQNAACNRLHSIEQRCARWLLMTHDRTLPTEPIHLKHEFLALMLGVTRVGVSVAAGALQLAGLIQYRRAKIRVLDREGLERASCECYRVVRDHFDRLLPA
jgi:CRP-like cAMP-binding protein